MENMKNKLITGLIITVSVIITIILIFELIITLRSELFNQDNLLLQNYHSGYQNATQDFARNLTIIVNTANLQYLNQYGAIPIYQTTPFGSQTLKCEVVK